MDEFINSSSFIKNKYYRWYFNICKNALERDEPELFEKHHILPGKFGGSDNKSNLAKLTFREHMICHRLLVKMLPKGKMKRDMSFALVRFMSCNKNNIARRKLTSREFEQLKKEVSAGMKGTKPSDACFEALSKKLKGVPLSKEHKAKIKETSTKIISCQLVNPQDEIIDVPDLKKFCSENKLSWGYMKTLLYDKNDCRLESGKAKGWGVYFGGEISQKKAGSGRGDALKKVWEREAQQEINRNTKYKWILQDPDGNIIETYSLGKLCKQLDKSSSQVENAPIGKVLVKSWAGWIKLAEINIKKEIKGEN